MTPEQWEARGQLCAELHAALCGCAGYFTPDQEDGIGCHLRPADQENTLDALLARPDLIRVALGMTLWSVEFRNHDGWTFHRDFADEERHLWDTGWRPVTEDQAGDAEHETGTP
ncbi:MAG: hypothetical protein ACRDQA_01960 [Nocardioidaceae bacterium]